jgi:hypothetical protein
MSPLMLSRFYTSGLIATAVAVSSLVCGLAPGAANAEGASTIASAGSIPLDSLVVGGGQPIDFYRIALSAGDQIDIDYDMLGEPNCGYLYLFDPTVTDFNLAQAKAVSSVNVRLGQQAVTLTSSFNGSGTLAVAIAGPSTYQSPSYPPLQTPVYNCTVVTPFSLTAAVEHLTQVSFQRLPTQLSSPNRHVRLAARVQSPAGAPVGNCMFERVTHSLPVRITEATARNGLCTASVRAGGPGLVTFRVTFTGTGWQTAKANSEPISVKVG